MSAQADSKTVAEALWQSVGKRVLVHSGDDVYKTADSIGILADSDLIVVLFGDAGNATLALTTKLSAAHTQLRARGYRVSVFFAGDINAEYFPSVWSGMSWPALQDKQYTALKTDLQPTILPAVYLFDKGGDVVEPEGRQLADNIIASGGAAFNKYVALLSTYGVAASADGESDSKGTSGGAATANGDTPSNGVDSKSDSKVDAPQSNKSQSNSNDRFSFRVDPQLANGETLFLEPKPKPPRSKRPAVQSATASLDACVSECREEVARIVATCRATGVKYTDPDFGPEPTSLYMNAADASAGAGAEPGPSPANDAMVRPTQWRRVTDLVGAKGRLVLDALEFGDVAEGGLGTRYLLSSIAALACGPKKALIENVFISHDRDVGVYGVRFFLDSEWYYIVIDDWLPCDATGSLCYARNLDATEYWMPILEKAYAKLHGSYEAISFGSETEALQDLSGGVVETIDTAALNAATEAVAAANEQKLKAAADDGTAAAATASAAALLSKRQKQLFTELRDRLAAGSAFCVSPALDAVAAASGPAAATATAAFEQCGLLLDHGYGVLRCHTLSKQSADDKSAADDKQPAAAAGTDLLQLRNPWERLTWTGAWSEGSKEWTDDATRELSDGGDPAGVNEEGTSWLQSSDFFRYFPVIHSCFIFDADWSVVSTWAPIPVDNMELHDPTLAATSTTPSASGAASKRGVSFTVRTPKETHVMIVVEQDNIRSKTAGQMIEYVQAIGFKVLLSDDATSGDAKQAAGAAGTIEHYASSIANVRGVNSWVTLRPDKTYIIVPFYINESIDPASGEPIVVGPRKSLDMHLRVYTKVEIKIEERSELAAEADQQPATATAPPATDSPVKAVEVPGSAATPPRVAAATTRAADGDDPTDEIDLDGSSADSSTTTSPGPPIATGANGAVAAPITVVPNSRRPPVPGLSLGSINSTAPAPGASNTTAPASVSGGNDVSPPALASSAPVATAPTTLAAPARDAADADAARASPMFGATTPTVNGSSAAAAGSSILSPIAVRASPVRPSRELALTSPPASTTNAATVAPASPVFASSPPISTRHQQQMQMALSTAAAAAVTASAFTPLFGDKRSLIVAGSGDVKSNRVTAASAFASSDLIVLVFGMGGCRFTSALLPNLLTGAASAAASQSVVTVVYVPTNYADSISLESELRLPSGSFILDPTEVSAIAKLKSQYRVFGFPWVVTTDRSAAVVEADASESLLAGDGRTAFEAWRKRADALRRNK